MYPTDTNIEGIISKDPPTLLPLGGKKLEFLENAINSSDSSNCTDITNNLIEYLAEQNKMMSGNFTLLTEEDLNNFKNLNLLTILMKGGPKNSLIGTILSIPLPVKCKYENIPTEIILHGCTTFLNVHSKLRGNGLCKYLINRLNCLAHNKNIYCGFQITHWPICQTAIPINTWYRPINLLRSLELGFVFPHYNELGHFYENRIKYACKKPKGFTISPVKNIGPIYNFYINNIGDKKFVYSPNLEDFTKWINTFNNSYWIFNKANKEIVGFFTFKTLSCKIGSQNPQLSLGAKICLPLLLVHKKHYELITLDSLLYIANNDHYDVLYCYQIGNMTENLLKSKNSIMTKNPSYFSLTNNYIKLKPEDILVPLF